MQVKHAQLNNKTTVAEPKGEKLREYSSVAQWRSNRLLTGRLLVRVQPGEYFFYVKFLEFRTLTVCCSRRRNKHGSIDYIDTLICKARVPRLHLSWSPTWGVFSIIRARISFKPFFNAYFKSSIVG